MLRRASSRLLLAAAIGCTLIATNGLAEAPQPASAAEAEDVAPGEAEAVLVSGEGIQITVADVETELARQPGRALLVRRDPEALKAFVEQMVRTELLAQEAERRGYGKNTAVVQAVKEEAVQELHRALVDGKVTPASITQPQIAAFYEANVEQFKRPAMRRARHILFEKKADAEALLAEAQTADDRSFQQLAREHSIDTETKQRGGDLRFFALDEEPGRREAPVHPALRKAAFALAKVGDTVKKPVAVDGRYSILRLTGIRQARETTVAQAEPSIRTRLWRQARKEALEKLMVRLQKELAPKVFPERIQAIDLTDVTSRPTGFAPDPPRARREAVHGSELKKPADP